MYEIKSGNSFKNSIGWGRNFREENANPVVRFVIRESNFDLDSEITGSTYTYSWNPTLHRRLASTPKSRTPPWAGFNFWNKFTRAAGTLCSLKRSRTPEVTGSSYRRGICISWYELGIYAHLTQVLAHVNKPRGSSSVEWLITLRLPCQTCIMHVLKITVVVLIRELVSTLQRRSWRVINLYRSEKQFKSFSSDGGRISRVEGVDKNELSSYFRF